MRAAKRKRGQRIRIMPDKRDLARSALAFGRSGGCAAGCKDCRYWELCRFVYLCEGGTVGEEQEVFEIGERNNDVQQLDEVRR